MNEPDPCYAELTRLREEFKSALALSSQDHASMLAALGESMRLRELNQESVRALLGMMTSCTTNDPAVRINALRVAQDVIIKAAKA